jgi:hypothetical protein
MKRTVLTIALAAASAAALAQGKVQVQNDSGSLYTLSAIYFLPADAPYAGQPIPVTGPLPSGIVLELGLYGGATAGALTLQGEELLNPVGGTSAPSGQGPAFHVVTSFPGYVPGVADYFRLSIWNSAYANPQLAELAGSAYTTFNNVFMMTPGTGIAYPGINNGGGTTWTAVGDETPLIIVAMPEPSALALVALGAVVFCLAGKSLRL